MLAIDIELKRGGLVIRFNAELNSGATGLVGPSGSGKTSLLHALAGLIRPDSGQIVLANRILYEGCRGICVPVHKRGVGLVFQEDLLFPHMSVRKNLLFGANSGSSDRLEEILETFEIGHLIHRKPRLLSGGERRRVAIARALLNNPEMLLLDEPFSGLDGRVKRQILCYLGQTRKRLDIPMVLVSHDMEEVAELCDEVIFIEDGSIVAHGTCPESRPARFCQSNSQHTRQRIRSHSVRNHGLDPAPTP